MSINLNRSKEKHVVDDNTSLRLHHKLLIPSYIKCKTYIEVIKDPGRDEIKGFYFTLDFVKWSFYLQFLFKMLT